MLFWWNLLLAAFAAAGIVGSALLVERLPGDSVIVCVCVGALMGVVLAFFLVILAVSLQGMLSVGLPW